MVEENKDIENFRFEEIKDLRNKLKNDIEKTEKIIRVSEILETVLILFSLLGSSLSAILKSQTEAIILASITSFINGLTIATKLKQSKEEQKLIDLKHSKSQLSINLSNSLDDNKITNKEFETILEITNDEK